VLAGWSRSLGLRLAVAGLLGLAWPGRSAGATGTSDQTAGSAHPPIYEFLVNSGISKNARPEAAVLRVVTTIERGGQRIATSTVMTLARQHQPDVLNAIQAAIVNGTLVEASESPKAGSLEIAYSDGNVVTVVIYAAYYEITTSAGTIRFTSEPLSQILHELIK
jgi:hypothetical protein